jgi:hypothetical protein
VEAAVIAYKFLSRGAIGPFSGFAWPTPAGGAPGPWVDARPAEGIHACGRSDLPYWIDEELWVAELSGDARDGPHQLVASRGRLLGRVEAWPDVARAFAGDCAARLRARVDAVLAASGVPAAAAALLRGYVADGEAAARAGNAAVAAYVAARASAVVAGSAAGFVAERRRQAAWLDRQLGHAGSARA